METSLSINTDPRANTEVDRGQVENSETSESDFPMFPFPSFRLRHRVYSKTRKMKAWKIFSEVPRFPRNPSFRIATFDRTFKRVAERMRV